MEHYISVSLLILVSKEFINFCGLFDCWNLHIDHFGGFTGGTPEIIQSLDHFSC